MTFADFKARVDALMNTIYASGLTNHTLIIEQLNYLIFLRSLSKRDDQAIVLDPDAEKIFSGELEKFRWDNLLVLNAETLFMTLDELYKKISDLTNNKTIRQLYQNAHLQIADKPTLRRVIHEIEAVMNDLDQDYIQGHTDVFGDMYEHLLGTLSVAGRAGQYRTPRHLIKFITEVVDPTKGETILDPACGTAGFLVAALEHLKEKYSSDDFKKQGKFPLDLLSPEERKFLFRHTLTGFDSDPSMFKFGLMNLYLHHLESPEIKRLNTLVDTAGDRTKWDIILANPPFSGAIEENSISEDLRMGTRATEILFLKYIMDHLNQNGRAGVIVPEGVIFSNSNAHKQIRQKLLEEGLWAVVSLPRGIFQPYTPTKTSIVFFDRQLKNKFSKIIFVDIKNDGYTLNTNRNKIDENDIPKALQILKDWRSGKEFVSPLAFTVEKDQISAENGFSLQLDRYKVGLEKTINSDWPYVKISELCEFVGKGIRPASFASEEGKVPFIVSSANEKNCDSADFDFEALVIGDGGSANIHYLHKPFSASDHTYVLKNKDESKVLLSYIYFMILNNLEVIESGFQGQGLKNVSKKHLEGIEIPLPPIEYQQKIINDLERYQEIIINARNILKNYNIDLKVNPDWKEEKLGDLIESLTDYHANGSYEILKKHVTLLDHEDYALMVRSTDFENNFKNDLKYITKEAYEFLKKSKLFGGEILINKIGNIGKVYLMPNLDRPASLAMNQFAIKVDSKKVSNEYIYYVLISDYGQKQINSLASGATTRSITKDSVRSIKIPLPSLEVQQILIEELRQENRSLNAINDMVQINERKIKAIIENIWGKNNG